MFRKIKQNNAFKSKNFLKKKLIPNLNLHTYLSSLLKQIRCQNIHLPLNRCWKLNQSDGLISLYIYTSTRGTGSTHHLHSHQLLLRSHVNLSGTGRIRIQPRLLDLARFFSESPEIHIPVFFYRLKSILDISNINFESDLGWLRLWNILKVRNLFGAGLCIKAQSCSKCKIYLIWHLKETIFLYKITELICVSFLVLENQV